MSRTQLWLSVMCLGAAGAVGCGTSTSSTQSTSDALASAQCTFQGFDAATTACFAAFDTCRAADGAVLQDCLAALQQCLPPPPDRRGPPPCELDGGSCPPPPDRPCDGDRDGGMGPGPMGGPGGRGGHHGPGGQGPRPLPDAAALTACHDALLTCLADPANASATCFEAERTCVHDAFVAAFQQACTDAQAACAASGADAQECGRCTARCGEGVDGPPGLLDGGTCG